MKWSEKVFKMDIIYNVSEHISTTEYIKGFKINSKLNYLNFDKAFIKFKNILFKTHV